jgi:hypothetical protein
MQQIGRPKSPLRIPVVHLSIKVHVLYSKLIVREGKGRKDRVVMLPEPLIISLRRQLEHSRGLWREDRTRRVPGVSMPDALARKYPRAAESWAWHWVFPSAPEIAPAQRGSA